MNNRGNFNLGDEIKNIVQDAVNNRDFNRLNRDIGRLVNGALDEVRQSIKRSHDSNRNGYDENNQKHNRNNGVWRSHGWKTSDYKQDNKPVKQSFGTTKPVPFTVPVGHVSSVLYTVFGAIGGIASAIAIIILGVLGTLIENIGLFQAFSLGLIPCLLACMVLYIKGRKAGKRLQRFYRYISQLQGKSYCLIRNLASATGMSLKYTVKDLQKMIAAGMFPQGHIDDKKTCFMLNNESYEQYMLLQDNMRMKDGQSNWDYNEQNKREDNINKNTIANQTSSLNNDFAQGDINKANVDMKPEVRKALDEGRLYVQKIKNANIAIPGEVISRKLDRLELVTGKIFDYVEIHPEKYPDIKKFTEYFLPTTLKLLDAYKELDYQPVEGMNISNTKKEIEDTLGTINMAFERLLDGLFEDTAMDVSTDISVLQTILAQEGLTEQNVSIK